MPIDGAVATYHDFHRRGRPVIQVDLVFYCRPVQYQSTNGVPHLPNLGNHAWKGGGM